MAGASLTSGGAGGATQSQVQTAVSGALSSQAVAGVTTGWWVLVAVVVSVAVSGTRVGWIAGGIMSIATIYQIQQWISTGGKPE